MKKTVNSLRAGGYGGHVAVLAKVSTGKAAWEVYARATFQAHAPLHGPGKLRFLRYLGKDT